MRCKTERIIGLACPFRSQTLTFLLSRPADGLNTTMRRNALLLYFVKLALASPFHASRLEATHDHHTQYGSPEFWWKLVIAFGLVLLGGVFAVRFYIFTLYDLTPRPFLAGRVSRWVSWVLTRFIFVCCPAIGRSRPMLTSSTGVLSASSDDETEKKNAKKGAFLFATSKFIDLLTYTPSSQAH